MTKNHEFFKNCRGNKFAVECERISRTSQNVRRIWAGLGKRRVFEKRIDSSETNEGSNFAVECDRISKTSQTFKRFEQVWKKDGFFEKNQEFFKNG